ncbi:MAG: hypothetical protein ABIV47_10485, partial [Roseiflexaceae bacterium]
VFCPTGQKTTHEKDKVPRCRRRKNCERKSYLYYLLIAGPNWARAWHSERAGGSGKKGHLSWGDYTVAFDFVNK